MVHRGSSSHVVGLNGSDPNLKRRPESNIDPFSRALVAVRSGSYKFLSDHKTATDYTLILAFNGLVLAYLIGAIYYYVDQGMFETMKFANDL